MVITAYFSVVAVYLVFVSDEKHIAVCGADLKGIWLVDGILSSFD